MSREIFERAKREINLKDYIITTCAVEAEGNNGAWSINPNPMDLQSKGNLKYLLKKEFGYIMLLTERKVELLLIL